MSSSPVLPSTPADSTSGVGGSQQFDQMFRRRLRALGHFDPDGFNANDKRRFRQTVVWLEDQWVRGLAPDEREGLREVEAEGWDERWEGYLDRVGCEKGVYQGRKNQLMWLLGRAAQLRFAENAESIRAKREGKKDEEGSKANGAEKAGDPFEGVNVHSPEFRQSVSALASKLKVTEYPNDALLTLHACCIYLSREKKRREAASASGEGKKKRKEAVQRVNLDEHDMNIPEEFRANKGLCQALKILRLLRIQDLRALQDEVNATIESAQKLTADPKTDTRLGKVGR